MAIELAYKNIDDYNTRLLDLREYYISSVEKRINDIRVNGDRENRLPGNANISFKGVNGEALLLKLDAVRNLYIGSAQHVIQGKASLLMCWSQFGVPADYLGGTLRVTFGEDNTKEDVDFLINKLCKIVEELRG